jgi:hypothetical protein
MLQIFLYHLKVTVHICRKIILQITSKPSEGMILCPELYHVVDENLARFHWLYIERDYSKEGATSVGLDSNTSEFEASGSSKSSRDWIDSLYAGVCLKSVAPSLYVATAIPHAISCQDRCTEYKPWWPLRSSLNSN